MNFCSGLNFLDLMVRQGNIDSPPKTPLVPGFECSGIVEAVGENTKGFEVRDMIVHFRAHSYCMYLTRNLYS